MTDISIPLDPAALSRRYFDAWAANDVDAIVALHTADSRFRTHGRGVEAHGSAALRVAFAEVFSRYPGFGFRVHRVLFGDRHWVLDWTLTFDAEGEGRRGFRCLDVVEVSETGLVTSKDTFFDAAQAKRPVAVTA